MSEFRRIPVRLSYNNPEHLNIMNTLDDLNLDVHKSRNSFIINAITFYMNAIQSDSLTYADEVKKREMEKNFVTRNELEEFMDEYMESIRTELYQEMIRFLAGVALSSGTSIIPDNEKTVNKTAQKEAVPEESDSVEENEDMAEKLSRYDSVLQNVMEWSED